MIGGGCSPNATNMLDDETNEPLVKDPDDEQDVFEARLEEFNIEVLRSPGYTALARRPLPSPSPPHHHPHQAAHVFAHYETSK